MGGVLRGGVLEKCIASYQKANQSSVTQKEDKLHCEQERKRRRSTSKRGLKTSKARGDSSIKGRGSEGLQVVGVASNA
jgi:hypothetical protein